MQLFKNTASQKIRVFAFADAGHASLDPGEPVTGDAANITAQTAVDNAALGASNDTNPAEVSSTNAPGYYEFDPTQGETNGDVIEWYPKSSTAGVQVVTVGGAVQIIMPPNLPDLGIESDGDLTKVNTLDGHTAQTGDNFARLGAPAGASVSADIAANQTDLNTIITDVGVVDGIVDAILVDTGTTLDGKLDVIDSNVDAILVDTNELQGDWTDAGRLDAILDTIAADVVNIDGAAMRGTDSAFLAASAPTNFSSLGINGSGHVNRVTLVDTTTTNTDMRGTDGANTTAPDNAGIAAAAADAAELNDTKITTARANGLDNLDAAVSSRSDFDETTNDVNLAATGLDNIPVTDPGGVASTFPEMVVQLWRRFFKRSTLTSTTLITYADDNSTANTTQTVSDDGTTQIQGPAS